MVVTPDEAHVVVSHVNHSISVYALPDGVLVRRFGRKGSKPGQFSGPRRMCFSHTGNILVAECWNKRLQEVTLAGEHVRFIGRDDFAGNSPYGIAANAELIAASLAECTVDGRVFLFSAVSGALLRRFGNYGAAPGLLGKNCPSLRFMPVNPGKLVIGSGQSQRHTLSVFDVATGTFDRLLIPAADVKFPADFVFGPRGEIVVCHELPSRVSVFAADGSVVVRSWGCAGDTPARFNIPRIVAWWQGKLLVMDKLSPRIQMFE